jgi:hypothetical protein
MFFSARCMAAKRRGSTTTRTTTTHEINEYPAQAQQVSYEEAFLSVCRPSANRALRSAERVGAYANTHYNANGKAIGASRN